LLNWPDELKHAKALTLSNEMRDEPVPPSDIIRLLL